MLKKTKLAQTVIGEEYILSKSNKKAVKRCFGVATGCAKQESVVFVYGPSPCGKTKLMHTTAKIYRKKCELEPMEVSFRQMMEDYITSINENTKNEFYNKYSSSKLLLIDDAHSVIGFSSTQIAFADIFTKLFEQGVNIILFSSYKLNRFDELNYKLKKANVNLIKVKIHKADFALRKEELRRTLNIENTSVSKKVFYYIVINKKIELASFRGCIKKISLTKILKNDKLVNKEIIKILKEYER